MNTRPRRNLLWYQIWCMSRGSI